MHEKGADFYYNLYEYAGLDPKNFLINCLPSLYLLLDEHMCLDITYM